MKDTGGALYKLKRKINNNFFLINGDTYFDIDYYDFLKKIDPKKICTLAITKNNSYKENKKITNIKINKKNRLLFTKEKTKLMNGGIYYVNKKLLNLIPNKKISLENEILPKLISDKKIDGFYFKNKFIDMGLKKNLDFLRKNPNITKQKAFFLDRDGVINKLNPNGYITSIKDFKFLNDIPKAIKYLNKHNFLVIIITNQACVGKSIITEQKLNNIHRFMKKKIYEKTNGIINDIFFSPYYKFSKLKKYRLYHNDRKPNSGMIKKAVIKWNIDLKKSFFIGDSLNDYIVAKKNHIKFYYKKEISLHKQIKSIIKK